MTDDVHNLTGNAAAARAGLLCSADSNRATFLGNVMIAAMTETLNAVARPSEPGANIILANLLVARCLLDGSAMTWERNIKPNCGPAEGNVLAVVTDACRSFMTDLPPDLDVSVTPTWPSGGLRPTEG